MANMSFALTGPQMLDQSKDITRRLGWLKLKAGVYVQPVQKCMGLRPGEKVVKIGRLIRIVSVRREPLSRMTDDLSYGQAECVRGFS
jgi:hypothetical protein